MPCTAQRHRVQYVERREHRRRAVAFVVVRQRPAATLLHRQSRLGAVERLDLRLLINRQHQRVLALIDIEADDIQHLGGELRVSRQLEGTDPVRFEAMRRPDALWQARFMAEGEGSMACCMRRRGRLAERR